VTRPDTPALLRAGIRVSDSFRASLERHGVSSVWIDDDLSAGIEPLESMQEETKEQAMTAIHDAFKEVSSSFAAGGTLTAAALQQMTTVAELIAADIAANVHSALALNDLANADGYTMKHSLAVTALGLALGLRLMRRYGWEDFRGERRFDDLDGRLSLLGVGLLLHDIGKLAVPPEILHKAGPLTADEWAAMRAHPELGFRMLKDANEISPVARSVVRSHHERWDGAGYPDGTAAGKIHQFARIAAVADVFDALTSDRPYRSADPPHRGYEYVVGQSGSHFDPEVVEMFRASVAPHPPGTGVVLSDGSCGIVKEVRQGFVTRPVVRVVIDPSGALITPYEVDLASAAALTIVSADYDPWARPLG
jgi:HD-GYP domain-containing protein (c-di-GMP phosphodiesterase class II)